MTEDAASTGPLLGQIILIIILTLINAFFAAAEMAYVSVDTNELEDEAEAGDRSSARVLRLLDDSDDFLSTIQIAITLAGFLNSASAATSIADYIEPLLGDIPGAPTISIIIITLIISYITLVFGELYPKALALQMPEKVAKATSGIVSFTNTLFKPFIWLLSTSTAVIKKITPVDFTATEDKMTRDEFRAFLDRSRQDQAIDLSEFSMLEGVLSLDHKMVRESMVPRTDAYMIDYDDGTEENIDKLLDLQYSRVPMYFDEKDNVLGIIHVKNLLKASVDQPLYEVDLNDIMNDALFVPETIYIDDLMYELQRTNNTMAIVTDEYGGVSGLITIEDIIEEIVGDIDDEYDSVQDVNVNKLSEGHYIVEGSMPLHDFNEFFDTVASSEAVDTIAGYFITETGIIPSESALEDSEQSPVQQTSMMIDHYQLSINKVEGTRISSLKVEKIDDEELEKLNADPHLNLVKEK